MADDLARCIPDEEAIAGAIATWRREGLLGVFVEAAGLLNEQGLEKHGVQGYRALTLEELRSKAIRHETRAGEVADSGSDHSIHGLVRSAQVAVLAGERR